MLLRFTTVAVFSKIRRSWNNNIERPARAVASRNFGVGRFATRPIHCNVLALSCTLRVLLRHTNQYKNYDGDCKSLHHVCPSKGAGEGDNICRNGLTCLAELPKCVNLDSGQLMLQFVADFLVCFLSSPFIYTKGRVPFQCLNWRALGARNVVHCIPGIHRLFRLPRPRPSKRM